MRKIVTFIFLLICSLMSSSSILASDYKANLDLSYLYDPVSGVYNPNWMEKIADDKLISDISIPGTHQSLSFFGGDLIQTQSLSISEQLLMGVRFFDVSFKLLENELYAFNNNVHQDTSFAVFLNEISAFLGAQPSESVIIRVHNAGSKASKNEFFKRFIEVTQAHKEKHFIPKNNNFFLGNARGKFVFISDFGVKTKVGMSIKSMFIQYDNKFDTRMDLVTKWDKVKNHANEFDSLEDPAISLNYLSGTDGSKNVEPFFFASGKVSKESNAAQAINDNVLTDETAEWEDFPKANCQGEFCNIVYIGVNQLYLNWIKTHQYQSQLGIVVADFPGPALINAIIKSN